MHVTFWGTRGSMVKAGPSTVRYGGNTSCVEVRSNAGTLVVLDCGTGLHGLGLALADRGETPLRGHILIGHTHWDHIQGFPFFAPLFVAGNSWDVYAPRGFGASLRDALAGQMHHRYFPVSIESLGAEIRYHDLLEGPLQLDDVAVHAHYLNHTALTLGYRLEADGAALVYACDHEPHAHGSAHGSVPLAGDDLRHVDFLRGADLVIHDAQYTTEEYASRVGWGHSTPEYAIAACEAAGARKLALTHFDPARSDDALDAILADVEPLGRSRGVAVFAAREGVTFLVDAPEKPRAQRPRAAESAPPSALASHALLLVATDPSTLALVSKLAAEDALPLVVRANADEAIASIEAADAALVLVDEPAVGGDASGFIARVRAGRRGSDVAILVLTSGDFAGGAPLVHALARPFSQEYARAKIRASVLRTPFRWQRAPLPTDERERLERLRGLAASEPESQTRFDTLTRLAAESFHMPIAVVSLLDETRRWVKSSVGLDAQEMSRDAGFCGHAILGDTIFIVPDALADERFADDPLVVGTSHVRFYAGCPLRLGAGSALGTLCLMDTRPRSLNDAQLNLLSAIGRMVERELAGAAARRGT